MTDWTTDQLRYMEWLATPRSEREPSTQEALAEELGIHWRTFYRWREKAGWQEAVNELARGYLKHALPEIYAALIAGALAGSYQHIELCLRLAGDYNPKATLVVDPTDRMSDIMARALAPWSQQEGGEGE